MGGVHAIGAGAAIAAPLHSALPAATTPAPLVPVVPGKIVPPAVGLPAAIENAASAPVFKRPPIEIYAYDAIKGVDNLVLSSTGTTRSDDKIANTAFKNANAVIDYFHTTFGRNGFDGKGGATKVRVHAPDAQTGAVPANNAYWMTDEKRLWFGDGDGIEFKPLGNAKDVFAHEFAHGIVDTEVKLDYQVLQQGALHESFADVLASGIDGNFQVAEDIYTPKIKGDALRDLAHPMYDNLKNMGDWVTWAHDAAGIPSLAAYRVADKVGGDTMRTIWYTALTKYLRNGSDFAGAADATLKAARKLYGNDSAQVLAVQNAWTSVGVDLPKPKSR